MEDTTELFKLLAADHRRRILFLLCDTDSLQLPEALLARGQARSHQPEDTDACSQPGHSTASEDESLDQIQIELRHAHLPELEEKELIEWNRDTQTVSRGPHFDEIEPVLRLLGANQDRFPDDLL